MKSVFPLLFCLALSAYGQSASPCPDADGDGICDSVDWQPFSPKGCAVDSLGIALDDDQDGVPNCFDKEPDSPPNRYPNEIICYAGPQGPPKPGRLEIICDADPDCSDLPFSAKWFPELYYLARVTRYDTALQLTACVAGASGEQANEIQAKVVVFLANTYQVDPLRWQWVAPCESEDGLPVIRVSW